MRSAIALLLALQLVSVKPPAARAAVLLGLDASASVAPHEFATYPAIVRTIVLPMLRHGDELVLVRLDCPDDPPDTLVVDRRASKVQDVKAFYERLQAVKPSRGPHVTDIGVVFDHLRRRIDLDRALKPRVTPAYIAIAVTDGVIDGRQTGAHTASAPIVSEDWRLAFIGIKTGTEDGVRRAAARAGFAQADRLLLVPYSHWRELAPSLSRFFGRPANAAIVSALEPPSREPRR